MITVGKSHTGMVRSNNQDSFEIINNEKYKLCVLCDGMGGAAGGKTASSVCCQTITEYIDSQIDQKTDKEYDVLLVEAIEKANEKVYNMSCENDDLKGMGTTACVLLVADEKMWAASVGDSRIYVFKDESIFQISHDHSYVQILIDSGTITKEESLVHPNKNIITRAVGTKEDIECDTFIMDFDVDGVLLCSDGLTNYLSDEKINEMFCEFKDTIQELAEKYIECANSSGGGDNITVVIAKK